MDLLKRELERKKKSVQKAKENNGGRRFFRASDLRRQEEEDEEEKESQLQNDSRKRKLASERGDGDTSGSTGSKDNKQHGSGSATSKNKDGRGDDSDVVKRAKVEGKDGSTTTNEKEGDEKGESTSASKMSLEEVTNRLRSLGYPIRLFGESLEDRVKRLRKALDEQKNVQAGLSEMDEFRLGRGHGIRNPFLIKDDKETKADDALPVEEQAEAAADGKKDAKDDNDDDLDDDDPHKRVYKYFKGLCKKWEDDLNQRPEEVKRSVAGRNETKTFKQCKDYIRPLFKLCKNRRMDEGILTKLNRIVSFCLEQEFVKAHDTYIDISIGRAAWPIGVTMVGIHARTGRAKIESSNVAHVMNSELQRKYLTSVKRLMTYAQTKSTADPSKKVL